MPFGYYFTQDNFTQAQNALSQDEKVKLIKERDRAITCYELLWNLLQKKL